MPDLFSDIGKNFFGGAGQEQGDVKTGTIGTLSPEQQAELSRQLQFFAATGGYSPTLIDTNQFDLNNETFLTGTVNPILRQVEQAAVNIGNKYAGQRTGTGRSRATKDVIQTGQQQISEALAQQAIEANKLKLAAITSNQSAELNAENLNLNKLATLLGIQTVNPYAIGVGGEQYGAGIGREFIQSGERGAEGFWQGGSSSVTKGIFGSDIRFKNIIKILGRIRGIIIAIWTWKKDNTYSSGFIAQNVIKVLPEAIIMLNGYMYVNYPMVIEYILNYR